MNGNYSFNLSRSKSKSVDLPEPSNDFNLRYIGCCQVQNSVRDHCIDIDRTVEELLASFSKADFSNLSRCRLTVNSNRVVMSLDRGSRNITVPVNTLLHYKAASGKHNKVFAFICKKSLTPTVRRQANQRQPDRNKSTDTNNTEVLVCHALYCNKNSQAERIAYRFLQITTQSYTKRLLNQTISTEFSSGDEGDCLLSKA
ncbi:hypothetical protein TrispH2_001729 [Trichoplax sp. H2]|nr:hypothetical protein TrispH2_001729 [Trichoplax sp. H2]|eukprot:RDD46123.1 hypothetical protein TrispH2_001729 [Trichoplax sp. H2]